MFCVISFMVIYFWLAQKTSILVKRIWLQGDETNYVCVIHFHSRFNIAGVCAYCLSPGVVKTELLRHLPTFLKRIERLCLIFFKVRRATWSNLPALTIYVAWYYMPPNI